jgi:parallel beta-helix repeat protein
MVSKLFYVYGLDNISENFKAHREKRLLRNRKSLAISILAILVLSLFVGLVWIWRGVKDDGTNPSSTNVLCGQFSNGTYFSSNRTYTLGSSGSAIINSAISEVSSAGSGHVTLVNGTWILTSPIVPQSNVNLTCYPGVTISQNAPVALNDSISLMLNTDGGVNNFVVDGGVWNGNKGSLSDFRTTSTWNSNFFSYFGISIYSSTQSSNITIENLEVENVIGQGIDLCDCQNSLVYNCTVINAGDNPITLDTSSSNSMVEYCTVVGGQDVGINTWGASNCTLQYNTVSNVTQYSGASHWGIAAEVSQNVNIIGNTISGCDYDLCTTSNNVYLAQNTVIGSSNTVAGIDIENTYNTKVFNNKILNCENYALETWGSSSTFNLQLVNNVIANCGQFSPAADGLIINVGSIPCPTHLDDSLNSAIENVALYEVDDYGAVSDNTFIANCSFSGSTPLSMPNSYNTTLQGNSGLSGFQTLNVTIAGLGKGTVAESNGNQSLSSITGNLWQFPRGSTTTLTATASSESCFDNFGLTNGTTTTSNPLTLVMNGNLGATAYFSASYTISASCDSHSTISPLGPVQVKAGGSQTFTYSADAGYKITSVLVDGSPVPITGSYTFTNVQAPHTISVSTTPASTPAPTATSVPTSIAIPTPSVTNAKESFLLLLVIATIATIGIIVGTAFLVLINQKEKLSSDDKSHELKTKLEAKITCDFKSQISGHFSGH